MTNTKRALFLSIVSMFLCIVMLASTTFAWFTDSVESTNNIIKTGTLKVTMGYSDKLGDTYADASEGAIFNYKLWEPGHTDEKYIEIKNEGDLAFRYNLGIVPTGEVSILADVIDVYFALNPTTDIEKFADAEKAGYKKVGTLAQLIADPDGMAYGVLLPASGSSNIDETQADAANALTGSLKAGILLHMQESAGNDYQDKSIGSDFRVILNATQFTYENDSFDNQYDVDATYPVSTNEEFEEAIDAVTDVNSGVDSAVIALASGTFDTNFKVAGGKDVTISGNGADTVLNGQIATTASNEGTLILRNLTVNVSDAIEDSTGISQTGKSAIAIWGDQTVICENVTFNMDLADSTAITSWWDTGVGTTIIVRNCTFNCNGQRPIRATGNVTVENTTFNDPYRYAVQLTAKTSTANLMDKAIINFNNNTIVNGTNGKDFVYGIQLEGADYGCHDCVINGSGNTIVNGGSESTMYYCECGKVDHNTVTFNTEVEVVHEG